MGQGRLMLNVDLLDIDSETVSYVSANMLTIVPLSFSKYAHNNCAVSILQAAGRPESNLDFLFSFLTKCMTETTREYYYDSLINANSVVCFTGGEVKLRGMIPDIFVDTLGVLIIIHVLMPSQFFFNSTRILTF